jgi:hypothetical protein
VDEPRAAIDAVSARATKALVAAAAALLAVSAIRVVVSWSHGSYLSYAEGTWCALALDVARGEWYRPASGPDGYGGTRYWPLVFGLHGLLLRVWPDPIASGLLLSAASFVAALVALFFLVRRLGGSRGHAALALLIFAGSHTAQYGLLAIRGDLLPLALLLGGAALSRSRPTGAAVLCALAVLGKPTSAYVIAVVGTWYLLDGRRRAFASFVGTAAASVLAGLVALHWASDGRALPLLFSAATAGAAADGLWQAPLAALRSLRLVPETVLSAAAAGVALFDQVALRARALGPAGVAGDNRLRAGILLSAAAAAIVAIFATPGVWLNHFVDLQAAAALVIALALPQSARGRRAVWAGVATLLVVSGIAMTGARAFNTDRTDRMRSYRAVLHWLIDHPGDILSEQPMIPVLAGRHVYMIDGFITRRSVVADPSLAEQIVHDLDRRRFAAVVLDRDLTAAVEDELIRTSDFGPAAIRALLQHYELDEVIGGRSLLRPRRP